jgi:hypothetical protein
MIKEPDILFIVYKLNKMYDNFSENKFVNAKGKEFYYLSEPYSNKYVNELYMEVDLSKVYYKINDKWIIENTLEFLKKY